MIRDHDKTKVELVNELTSLRRELEQLKTQPFLPKRDSEDSFGSSDEWQFISDILGDFIIVINPGGKIINCNNAVIRKFGFSADEIIGRNIFTLYPEERRNEAEDLYSQIIIGERYLCEIPFQIKNNSLLDVETKIISSSWHGEEVLFSISRDISAGKELEIELRFAFEKLKTIIDAVFAYIWSARINEDGSFTYIYQSPYVEKITGRSPFYFKSNFQKWVELIHPEDRAKIIQLYEGLMRGDVPHSEAIYRIYHADGSIRWVSDNILARKFSNRQVRLDGVITDVTERRAALEALIESEARLKAILSSIADMVFAFDADTHFTFYHAPDQNSLYAEPDQFIGRRHDEVMPPTLHEYFNHAFEKIKQGKAEEFDYSLMLDDTQKYFSARLSPIMEEGSFIGGVAVVRDVTEERSLEQRLNLSEWKYHELFMNIREGCIITNPDGAILGTNPPFQILTGYSRDELAGMRAVELTSEKSVRQEKKIIEKEVMKRGFSSQYKKEYIHKNGSMVSAIVKSYYLKGEDGNEYFYTIVDL